MSLQDDHVLLGKPDINNVHADASPSNPDPFKFSHGLTGVDQPANYFFVNILLATLLVPFTFAFVRRVVIHLRNNRRRISVINSCTSQNFWRTDRYSILGPLKRHFLHAPLVGDRHSRELWVTSSINLGILPTRPQLLVIIVYISSNVAYCFAVPSHLSGAKWMEQHQVGCRTVCILRMGSRRVFRLHLLTNTVKWTTP